MAVQRVRHRLPKLSLPWSSRKTAARSDHVSEDDYELGAKLGSGTVAVVRRALRRSDGTEWAVKIVCSQDPELRDFTCSEHNLLKTLKHAGIVKVQALLESNWDVKIVMELCPDGSLHNYRRQKGALEPKHRHSLFHQLLSAVDYMHHKRVVHRDLKPKNCLVTGGGTELRVSDFNSAKVIGNSAESSCMLTNRGTASWSAPELVLGFMWNELVDEWACGMILYYMILGRAPFSCDSHHAKEYFLEGRLPPVAWEGFRANEQQYLKLCLAVNMLQRLPAMMLLRNFAMLENEEIGFESWFDSFLSSVCEYDSWPTQGAMQMRGLVRASSMPALHSKV